MTKRSIKRRAKPLRVRKYRAMGTTKWNDRKGHPTRCHRKWRAATITPHPAT